jgi:hypothetical protein
MNLLPSQARIESRPARVPLAWWVRGLLLLVALGWIAVFSVAVWLVPYDEEGRPLRMESHRQLGLPPCTFKVLSGLPCPSCGMTTSFALLVRGDLINSLRANAVGTLLALFGLAFVPWSIACVICKRYFFIESMELLLLRGIIAFLLLMLVRWGIVLVLGWLFGIG